MMREAFGDDIAPPFGKAESFSTATGHDHGIGMPFDEDVHFPAGFGHEIEIHAGPVEHDLLAL